MARLNCILVQDDMNSRMRLKQAMSSVVDFGQLNQLGTLPEALRELERDTICDVVFVSTSYEMKAIEEFITKAKTTKQGQDSAYVALIKSQSEGNTLIATLMMAGANGFLCEPYSVDNLVEITRIATKVRKERSEAREKAAITLHMKEVMNQLDLVAYLKQSGCEPGTSLRVLREMCETIQRRSGESLETYHRIAIDLFENADLPKQAFKTKVYGGVSSRVKARMEKKLQAEIKTGETV